MATIIDVAKAAGVSIAAVSITLNGPETKRVGAAKGAKIVAEAKRLGYMPNVLARGLHRLGTRIGSRSADAGSHLLQSVHCRGADRHPAMLD